MQTRNSVAGIGIPCIGSHMKLSAMWPKLALIVALAGCGPSGLPGTPLFVGVGGSNYAQGTKLILNRLRARFPNGSSEPELVEYLERQGLRVGRTEHPAMVVTRSAYFNYGSIMCGSQIRVTWSADVTNKIQNIEAFYGDAGCP